MNRKPGLWATVIALAVMVGLSVWAAPQLPDRVPMQWGIDGEVNRYGSRTEALIASPLIAAGMGLLLAVLPRIDPRRRHLEQSARAYNAVWIGVLVLMTGLHAAVLLSATGRDVPVTSLVPLGVGLLFLVVGNYLGKVRSNWFLGIRTPWTLSSERSWDRTHRLAGRLFAVVGILSLLAVALAPQVTAWFLGGGTAVIVIVTFAYSYVVWRDDPDRASVRS